MKKATTPNITPQKQTRRQKQVLTPQLTSSKKNNQLTNSQKGKQPKSMSERDIINDNILKYHPACKKMRQAIKNQKPNIDNFQSFGKIASYQKQELLYSTQKQNAPKQIQIFDINSKDCENTNIQNLLQELNNKDTVVNKKKQYKYKTLENDFQPFPNVFNFSIKREDLEESQLIDLTTIPQVTQQGDDKKLSMHIDLSMEEMEDSNQNHQNKEEVLMEIAPKTTFNISNPDETISWNTSEFKKTELSQTNKNGSSPAEENQQSRSNSKKVRVLASSSDHKQQDTTSSSILLQYLNQLNYEGVESQATSQTIKDLQIILSEYSYDEILQIDEYLKAYKLGSLAKIYEKFVYCNTNNSSNSGLNLIANSQMKDFSAEKTLQNNKENQIEKAQNEQNITHIDLLNSLEKKLKFMNEQLDRKTSNQLFYSNQKQVNM